MKIVEMGIPSLLLPPVMGDYVAMIDPRVVGTTREYLLRHELGHVLAGDAGEPLSFQFPYPLPEAELVADIFAFADLIDTDSLRQGAPWVERRIRELVRFDYEPWYRRVERTADVLIRVRQLDLLVNG